MYKLTHGDGVDSDNLQWSEGVTHTATGYRQIHCYDDPLLAVFFNPIHCRYFPPTVWQARGQSYVSDHGVSFDCQELTTLRRISTPVMSIFHRVCFSILAVSEVTPDMEWRKWADQWITGIDQGGYSAELAARNAWARERAESYSANPAYSMESAAADGAAQLRQFSLGGDSRAQTHSAYAVDAAARAVPLDLKSIVANAITL